MAGQRIKSSEIDLGAARMLRDYAAGNGSRFGGESIQSLTGQLESGNKFFIKYGGGKNLSRAMEYDLNRELGRLGIDNSRAFGLVEAVVKFCVVHQYGDGIPSERLQRTSIELSELLKIDIAALKEGVSFDELLDDFIYFKALRNALDKVNEILMFDTTPLAAVAGDRVELMLRIRQAGFKIDDVEGAIDFWKDGMIEPKVTNGVVQLSDLMSSLEELMG